MRVPSINPPTTVVSTYQVNLRDHGTSRQTSSQSCHTCSLPLFLPDVDSPASGIFHISKGTVDLVGHSLASPWNFLFHFPALGRRNQVYKCLSEQLLYSSNTKTKNQALQHSSHFDYA
ncbi:hypothetical protein Tco_1360235 [Tanacetum coccineum]